MDAETALRIYNQYASKIDSQVHDALAGRIKVSPQSLWSEAWIAYALYFGGSQLSLEGVIQNADVVGHALPSAEEIAWGLLTLRRRKWLLEKENSYGLTMEGRTAIESIVVKGDLRKSYQRLQEWISAHPTPP